MRTKVGLLAAGLAASVLSFGAPAAADTTSTTVDETSTTTEATSTTVEETTTTLDETSTTVEETTTTTAPCATTTTIADGGTTSSSVATETTAPCDDSTTTTVADPPEPEAAPESSSTTTEPGSPIGPAMPGTGTPGRGTQVQSRPLPPKPTTTTTTLPPVPSWWQLPPNSGSGRRVVYSKSAQRVWVVDSAGRVIKKHLVSGRQTPLDPRPGTYRVWSRSRYTHSINNPSITWGYMVRFAWGARGGNIGFHEIPYQYGRPVQSVSQLGQPLSGGCVRQAKPDAIWMWNWAQLGTKVVVLG